ncbi:hypothetical protein [Rossellomorea yichunensis]|uniref:hypothetical protein n=1 Tax=Rossellomorea yichunensis TaxID=3077331 RepID=UPI0028DDDC44|nr:hypothetical protein [Rossellomorea sp. YC4-1]MDT9027898.1 hypothetical protein [Rossellomorea sp. YC4-1]
MSFPTIPNITAEIDIDRDDVINLLLASIAFEELALAHILNAEAEKIQLAVGTLPGLTPPPALCDLLKVNDSVQSTMKEAIKKEMLLLDKLEQTINIIALQICTGPGCSGRCEGC